MSKEKTQFSISIKELDQRAASVIELAKDNSVDSVIVIFELISLPFDGKNYKKKLFEKIFELANINGYWNEELGYIILSENKTKKTIVSHMDLIKKFNNGFSNDEIYKVEDNKLIGALDNTFTNAVLINSILNKQNKDTTYLFTLDEETTQYAIKKYMKGYGTEQFIINLDVTNDGWKQNMSIEYDEPCYQICKQINKNLDNPYFTIDRVCDDLDEVMKANGKGFSYCLPTKETIHSYKNYTDLSKIEPYMNGLYFIIHKLCLKNIDNNINHLNIDKAIKYKTFEKMKEKDIYITPKIKSNNKKLGGKEYYDYHSEDKYSGKYFCDSCHSYFNNKLKGEGSYWCPHCHEKVYIFEDDNTDSEDFISLVLSMSPKGVSKVLLEILETEESFDSSSIPMDTILNLVSYGLVKNHNISSFLFDYGIKKSPAYKIYSVLQDYPLVNTEKIYKLIFDGEITKIHLEDIMEYSNTNNALVAQQALYKLVKKKLIKKSNFKII